MDTIINCLKLHKTELKNFLSFSKSLGREIAGSYRYNPLDNIYQNDKSPNFEVHPDIKLGAEDSVMMNESDKNDEYIPFHTHLNARDPPSGDDISQSLYNYIKYGIEYSIIIETNGIYMYKIRTTLLNKIQRKIYLQKSVKKMMLNMKCKVNKLAIKFNKNNIDIKNYLENMYNLGIIVNFVEW